MNLVWAHANRLIRQHDLDAVFVAGPGHGGPGPNAAAWLEGTYSELYSHIPQDERGMRRFFRQFSFPGGVPSHCAPETPGSFHEGGELGYALFHAFGAVLDNPDLVAFCVIGDGEAETGPLAASWHVGKLLNPASDGAVVPVLHLNGFKIANPTMLARIPQDTTGSATRTRVPRRGDEQEGRGRTRLPPAGRQHAPVDLRPLPAQPPLRQRRRRRQTAWASYLTAQEADLHCTRGVGIWPWAGTKQPQVADHDPDVVLACAGDIPTLETLAAAAMLRERLPDLVVRVVNIVDLMRLLPDYSHPHGLPDHEFDALFTTDRPVIFAFHGYPWLVHRLTYKRRNYAELHVRGYKEEGTTATPFDMVMLNDLDRFRLVIDVIDRVPGLASRAAGLRQEMLDARMLARAYTREHGEDDPEIAGWTWPG